MGNITGDLNATLPMITCSMTSRQRINYGLHHMLSAALLTRLSFKIEKNYIQRQLLSESLQIEHNAYTVGAIMAAISSLDATINDGAEYTQGILATAVHAYTVGTDIAFAFTVTSSSE